MNKVIKHVLSILAIIISLILILFLGLELELRNRNIIKTLNRINYYDKVQISFNELLKDYIINEEVYDLYKDYFTTNLIKSDLNNQLNNVPINHYDDLFNIIKNYKDDYEIDNKYALEINNLYIKNLFPYTEYKIINKLYLSNISVILISIILIVMLIFTFVIIYIYTNSLLSLIDYIRSMIILLLIPFIFIELTKINNMIYTNEYYSEFLLSFINRIVFITLLSSLIYMIFLFVYKIFKKKKIIFTNS